MCYHNANLYPASETEENLINFRHLEIHLLRCLQITYLELWWRFSLNVIQVLKSGAFLAKAAQQSSLNRLQTVCSAG